MRSISFGLAITPSHPLVHPIEFQTVVFIFSTNLFVYASWNVSTIIKCSCPGPATSYPRNVCSLGLRCVGVCMRWAIKRPLTTLC